MPATTTYLLLHSRVALAFLVLMAGLTTSTSLVAGTVSRAEQSEIYHPWIISGNLLRIFVYGRPMPGATAEQIADALDTPDWAGDVRFTVEQHKFHLPEGSRLVLIFGGGVPNADEVCSKPDTIHGEVGGSELEVFAVYCSGVRFGTTAYLTGPAANGLDDPVYRENMRQLMTALFPSRVRTRSGDDR